ncbi:MAG: hypothetical protein AABY26_06765, partial [Nanoarchaeota archaeon]
MMLNKYLPRRIKVWLWILVGISIAILIVMLLFSFFLLLLPFVIVLIVLSYFWRMLRKVKKEQKEPSQQQVQDKP